VVQKVSHLFFTVVMKVAYKFLSNLTRSLSNDESLTSCFKNYDVARDKIMNNNTVILCNSQQNLKFKTNSIICMENSNFFGPNKCYTYVLSRQITVCPKPSVVADSELWNYAKFFSINITMSHKLSGQCLHLSLMLNIHQ